MGMTEKLVAAIAVIAAGFLVSLAYQMGKVDGFDQGSEYAHMMALDKVHDLSEALEGVFKQ
jgi:hypothetical protein